MSANSKVDIFLAEDDRNIVDVVRALLRNQGIETYAAQDGKKALSYINGLQVPKLALLDIHLPYHDGFELIDAIRANERWDNVHIIMLTGNAQKKDVERAVENGVLDYIVKPFKPVELMERIRKYL